MKIKFYRLCGVIVIGVMLFSCGKLQSDGKISVEENESGKNSIIVGAQIKIPQSSSGYPWKLSYGQALDTMFSDAQFSKFFEVRIVEQDLITAGCLNFNEMSFQSKKVFYTVFVAAIAEAESDFEVDQKTFNQADGTMNIGMLQIDLASANRHGSEFFQRHLSEEDLIKPETNLIIGALILKNQITGRIAGERLFPPTTYYWQVLTGSKRRFLRNLGVNLSSANICNSK